jgi:hypothetical protein
MRRPFIGSEALGDGLTRGQLRWNYVAALPNIYLPNDATRTILLNAEATWLWTGRTGVIAGRAAAALHGALWVDDSTPVEVITDHTRPRRGIIVREERIARDEITTSGGVQVTTPARTALDLARHLPRDTAVLHLDALAAATGVTARDALALAPRYRGARGIRRAPAALDLMDAGAQSPKETWLRLLLIDEGFPRPRTQIGVTDGFAQAFLDMGYDDLKVGLDYDGALHQTDRRRYVHDVGRNELIARQGWINLHVVAEHSRRFIVQRVTEAFQLRGYPPSSAPGS